jgi:hypothetical protein
MHKIILNDELSKLCLFALKYRLSRVLLLYLLIFFYFHFVFVQAREQATANVNFFYNPLEVEFKNAIRDENR